MLIKLKRTDIGPFKIKQSISQKNLNFQKLKKTKLNILETIKKINKYFLRK